VQRSVIDQARQDKTQHPSDKRRTTISED